MVNIAEVPNLFLAPGTGFMENNFSTDQGGKDSFRMIQMCYTYSALYISIIIASDPPQIIRHWILLQCTGTTKRIIWPQMLITPRLRNNA